MQDSLGDRLKEIEQAEAGRRAVVGKPIMVRLDGRHFSLFTKGLKRPFDPRMSQLMIDTTKYLLKETSALIGYTQSDEISLVYYETEGQYLFGGKYQKLTSTLAAMASAFFNKKLPEYLPEKANQIPTFDCRVWQVENMREAYLNFLWRQDDASKNSISMLAQSMFTHKELHGKNSEEKKRMCSEKGETWDFYQNYFKYGTFIKRVTKEVYLTPEQLEAIPEKHRPMGPVVRSFTEEVDIGCLHDYKNPQEVLFGS